MYRQKKLYDTISLAIKYLDDIDELIPFLERKGREHAEEFHCDRKHYEKIGECLFWSLKRSLGNTAWTKDVEEAWIWVYDVFSKTMADAGETYLLQRRKAAVLRTWQAVEDALEMKNNLATQATQLFYEHLFEKHPSIMPMFENSDIHGQAIKLFKTIHMAVHVLDCPDDLTPTLQEMGRRHGRKYKIKREHYDAVGECLVWTLKMGLGDAWTEEVADAWTWVYHMMAKTMADASEEAEKKE
jgi:hemoglobin-like flavoprotein